MHDLHEGHHISSCEMRQLVALPEAVLTLTLTLTLALALTLTLP